MPVQSTEQITVEPEQRRSVFDLDQSQDVGTNLPDHPGSHTSGGFVDCLFGQLNPPDPITASVGYDLHLLFVIARLAVKRTTIFSKPRPLRIQCLIAANLLLFFCR